MAQEKELLCMSCMQPVPAESASCPSCGYDGTQQNPDGLLPIGSRLSDGAYIVGRVEKVNTFSVDYVGYDVKKLAICCVKEYLPAGATVREKGEKRLLPVSSATERYKKGLTNFLNTYQKLGKSDEQSALPVQYACFLENGTAYSITDRFEGMTLRELLRKNGGTLSVNQTDIVMKPVLKALDILHSTGLSHGGICPDSILINKNGDVRIIGLGTREDSDAQGLSGYQAPEIYSGDAATATSDVYSVAAVYYRCLVGTVPQEAVQRKSMDNLTSIADMDENISQDVSAVIWNGMVMDPALRTANIKSFSDAMDKALSPVAEGAEELLNENDENTVEESLEKKKSLRWLSVLILSAALFLITLAVFFLSKKMDERDTQRKENQETEYAETLVTVPNYVGVPIDDVEFDTLTFDYVIVNTYNDGETDIVTSQEPVTGTGVGKDERLITLYVNREKGESITLSDYKQKNIVDVMTVLKSQGVNYKLLYETTDQFEPDIVLAQYPEPGTDMYLTDTVTLVVSKADESAEESSEEEADND